MINTFLYPLSSSSPTRLVQQLRTWEEAEQSLPAHLTPVVSRLPTAELLVLCIGYSGF